MHMSDKHTEFSGSENGTAAAAITVIAMWIVIAMASLGGGVIKK